mmetsp:Transcript_21646/g.49294  ORF Transcript_21646/g.49294 Transcript_21646/m.49294 type:complete len:144 (+) Transcript_21646:86-517(+)
MSTRSERCFKIHLLCTIFGASCRAIDATSTLTTTTTTDMPWGWPWWAWFLVTVALCCCCMICGAGVGGSAAGFRPRIPNFSKGKGAPGYGGSSGYYGQDPYAPGSGYGASPPYSTDPGYYNGSDYPSYGYPPQGTGPIASYAY